MTDPIRQPAASNATGSEPPASDAPGFAVVDHVRANIAVQMEKLRAPRLLPKKPKKLKGKRDRHAQVKVAFFRYCYYDPAFKFFAERVLDAEYLPLPNATRQTTEVGAQNSNDYVCTPFKHILGDFIEALDAGADVLVQFGGPCRLGYYGELQESILRDMGYDFVMLNFSHGIEKGLMGWAKECIEKVNPDVAIPHSLRQLAATGNMIVKLDEAHDFYLANAGFERKRGSFKHAWESFMDILRDARTDRDINEAFRTYMDRARRIELDKPASPIRIGIVGEMFTAIDERSNLNLDQKLIDMGVEVHRTMNLTNRFIHYNEPNLRVSTGDYLTYDMGPTSTITVAAALKFAQAGFDGVIHAKSAGCTPEIDCVPVLQRIGADFGMPMLYLTYDAQTSDTGLDTRLEAYYDMLAMKKERIRK